MKVLSAETASGSVCSRALFELREHWLHQHRLFFTSAMGNDSGTPEGFRFQCPCKTKKHMEGTKPRPTFNVNSMSFGLDGLQPKSINIKGHISIKIRDIF